MKEEVLIKAEGVSKKFCRNFKKSLFYGVLDVGNELLGNDKKEKLRKDEFWAVDDISFELRRGECLGLIGHNGAGKSTLLKILNGLFKPDKGKITMKGRIAALIELGAGFNPVLTGRENIYINGAVLGFSKKEIDEKFDAIVEFSEIEKFIDTPVQNYSSGMKVRLGFSVASQLEPDVLLIDEVLAVGDAGFKIKSYNKISELMQSSAVIFVSHSMPSVSRISSSVLLMENGISKYQGENIAKGIDLYFSRIDSESGYIEYNELAQISRISLYDENGNEIQGDLPVIKYGNDFHIEMEVEVSQRFEDFELLLAFIDKDMKIVGQHYTASLGYIIKNKNKPQIVRITIPKLNLSDGEYSITFFISSMDKNTKKILHLASYRNYLKFKVTGLNQSIYAPIHFLGKVIE